MESLLTSLIIVLFSLVTFADSTQYSGFKEWKSQNFGIEAEGHSVKVASIDNDSNLEIIVLCENGIFRVFQYDGNTYQQEWASPSLASTLDDLAIGDLDNDGINEIVVSTMEAGNTQFYVYGFNGSSYQLEYQSSIFAGDGYIGLSVYAVDTDNDGTPEIVLTSDEGNKAYGWIFNYNGSTYVQAWASGLLDTYDVLSFSGASDINGSGTSEIVFTGEKIYVFELNGSSYQLQWQSSALNFGECVLGNVDNNIDTELVAFTEAGTIQVYGYNGSTYALDWESAYVNISCGKIGDVDNDGINEIAAGSFNGDVYVFGYNGSTFQQQWLTATEALYTEVDLVEDLDGYGGKEILVTGAADEDNSDWTGYCDVYTYNSGVYQLAWRDEIIDSYFGGFFGAVGDIDGDGIPEEVRSANNEDRFYPYSIYVAGPARQMPNCSSLLKGDTNGDCKVNVMDLSVMAVNWLACNLIEQGNCDGAELGPAGTHLVTIPAGTFRMGE